VFFGAQTAQKPKKYDDPMRRPTRPSRRVCRTSWPPARFAHYLKVMGRDKIGSFMEASDCEKWLNNWIQNYVNADGRRAGQEMRAKYPLREAQDRGQGDPRQPRFVQRGRATCGPWLQMEELTASLRLVAKIPEKK
jgi:type VI secretion system protein ImpC